MFRGVVAKLQGSSDFLEFWIYFSKGNHVEYIHGPKDRVHSLGT
jgi:hypothetical protein